MPIEITRRDLLNGMAIGAGGILLPAYGAEPGTGIKASGPATFSSGDSSAYYPPTLTGMRGSHEGSFEVAHALAWRGEKPDQYRSLDEHYDLVVVGAGMSGLAAALFYRRKMGADARILLLDNHDDFGGHAKRNEFHQEGRMVLSLGGAQNLENPSSVYSDAAISLLADIGIDQDYLDAMDVNTPEDFGLAGNFDANNGMMVPGPDGHVMTNGNWMKMVFGEAGYERAIHTLPIPETEQDKLIVFFSGDRDYLDDLSVFEKYDYIKSVSYNQFLIERVGLAEETLPILNSLLLIYAGLSGWNMTVLEAINYGAPAMRSMGWLGDIASFLAGRMIDGLEVRMFPDGNASVARLLVRHLIPDVATEMKGAEDVAIAQFDYSALDREKNTTRLRLNSTVVGVREVDGGHAQVDYIQQGEALRVSADHCVLACYNGLIPNLCPEMAEKQKKALRYGVKVPFVYANVLLRNGQAFAKLGATMTQCPYDPFQWVSAAPTMTTGGYEPPRGPDDPMAVFMMASPIPGTKEQGTARDLLRIGRHQIYATPFAQYEKEIRDQLQAMLGRHGFNHESDISAITVNRIPHGYAYSYLGRDDPEWDDGEAPHEIGRAQFGRISIANSDSEARAFMNAAFDAAWRAVEEQTQS